MVVRRWMLMGCCAVLTGASLGYIATAEVPATAPVATQAATASAATTPATRGAAIAQRVVVISIDGLRPDLALRAEMPNLRGMLKAGSHTMWARTTAVAITLPSHVSMMTGVPPEKHGVNWNDEREDTQAPKVPTLFDLAKAHGLSTALAAGKGKFDTFTVTGHVDWASVPALNAKVDDLVVASNAAEIITAHRPAVMLVHLANVDTVGHADGWGTPKQIKTIEKADQALGVVLGAIKDAGIADTTLVIVTADHGGAGKKHGAGDARSRHIPWIATGPRVRSNLDLTLYKELDVNTEDTFATACHFLGLRMPQEVAGKPVLKVLDPGELMVEK